MRITRDERNFYDELFAEDDDDAMPDQEVDTAFANATDAVTCAGVLLLAVAAIAACMAWC
jgi:hypothetical protein